MLTFLWLIFVPLSFFSWIWYFKNVKSERRHETDEEVEKRTGKKCDYWDNPSEYIRTTKLFYFKHLLIIIFVSILPIVNAVSFFAFVFWFIDDIRDVSLSGLIDPNTKFNRFLLNIHKFLNKPL